MAASWSLKTQLKAPKREHAHTFFGATTAATFMQLRADLFDGPHPQHINFSVRRSVSDYRTSIYFLAGSILRTAFSRASWPVGSSSVTRLTRNSTVDKRLIVSRRLTSSVPALGVAWFLALEDTINIVGRAGTGRRGQAHTRSSRPR